MDEARPDKVQRVYDVDRTIEFKGQLIADVSTQVPESPRWLEMFLYKVTDGTGRYVLHKIGCSNLYHRHDGVCNTGMPVNGTELTDDDVPCSRCNPTRSDATVDVETNRDTTVVCANAVEVIGQLRTPRPAASRSSGFSAPARRLLDQATQRDEGIEKATMTVERL